MLKLLLSAALLLTSLTCSAQAQVHVKFAPLHAPTFRYGVRAGGQVMGVHSNQQARSIWYNGQTTEVPQQGLWGGNAGVAAEMDFGWLALQPSVLFMQKGYRFTISRTETSKGTTLRNSQLDKQRASYIEVPVNVVLTVKSIQLLAGPYVGVGVGGRYSKHISYPMGSEYGQNYSQYEYEDAGRIHFEKMPQGANTEAYIEHRLDAGFNLGVGYRHNGWQLQPTYSRSIRSTSRTSTDLKWSAQLNLTYFFGPGA